VRESNFPRLIVSLNNVWWKCRSPTSLWWVGPRPDIHLLPSRPFSHIIHPEKVCVIPIGKACEIPSCPDRFCLFQGILVGHLVYILEGWSPIFGICPLPLPGAGVSHPYFREGSQWFSLSSFVRDQRVMVPLPDGASMALFVSDTAPLLETSPSLSWMLLSPCQVSFLRQSQ
jgi:hypothetical protein